MNRVAALTNEAIPAQAEYRGAVVPAPSAPLPAHVPVPADETDAFLSMIERAARDVTVDVGKMERLMQMRAQVVMDRAEREFNQAMRDVQAELPRVFRNQKGDQGRYANLEAIDVASRPIITKHGFSESYGTQESPLQGHYRVTCLLSHVGGFSRPYQADVPTDMVGPKGNAVKTAIHGFGSSMSYGRRYLKCLIFNIVLTNEDDDGRAAGGAEEIVRISPEQLATFRKEMEARAVDEQKFCDFAELEKLENMAAANFDEALKRIRLKKQTREPAHA